MVSNAFGQTPTSLIRFGGTTDEEARTITTDGNGNVFIGGYFGGTVDFDPSISTTELTAGAGTFNAYVSKFNPAGDFLWVHHLLGIETDVIQSIAVDNSGNSYLTGYFFGSVNVDPGATNQTLTSTGDFDVFLVKLDANGILVWAKSFGSGAGADDFGSAVQVDASGNVYTTGYFNGSGDFDPGVGVTTLSSAGDYDIYISKFNTAGDCLFAKRVGGTGMDFPSAIDISALGIYITGSFRQTVDFDLGAGTQNLISAGDHDIFVLKMNGTGETMWAKRMGGTNSDVARSISIGSDDDIYSVGTFTSFNADFDPGPMSQTMSPSGGTATYISKLDVDGNYVWAKQITGSVSNVDVSSVSVSPTNEITVVGGYSSTAEFDPSSNVYQITAIGGSDVFVARYTNDGNFISAQSHGGPTDDKAMSVTNGSNGNFYVAGYYTGNAAFQTAPVQSFNTYGEKDVFYLSYESCQATNGIDVQEHCSSYTWIDGQTYTTSNSTATYTLENVAGCDSVVTLNLTINNLPNTGISGSGDTYSAVATGVTYQWINCGTETEINGATNQTFTATENGTFAVIIDNGTCTDTSNCVTVSGLAISENTLNILQLSPNPTTGLINIQSDANAEAILTNVLGEYFQTISLDKGNNTIDLSGSATGVYFVVLTNKQTYRIVKL